MEKRIFLGILAVLVTCLVLMAVQSVLGTDGPRIYHVSVLLDGAGDNYWRNFKKGITQAAQENNVDVRFISWSGGAYGQAQALREEWEGEADGVVVVPVDGPYLGQVLSQAPSGLSVTLSGPAVEADRPVGYVSSDSDQMGVRLAEAVAESGADFCTVYISGTGTAAQRRSAGFTARLEELGVAWQKVIVDPEWALSVPATGAVAALEPQVTELLCQVEGAAGRVYGIGTSNRLLRYVEDGVACALVVQSDYDAGYLSLLNVVSTLEGGRAGSTVLESYAVTKDNMFEDPLVQILFPIS